jgi:TerC family integral membrane protein
MTKEEITLKENKTSIDAKGNVAASITLAEEEDAIYKTAIQRTLAWVAASAAFGTGLFFVFGQETSEEYFAGYLLEQSLSVDNLLVFLLLFEYFQIPQKYQNRVLNWGILGALVMRAIMIGLGSVALQQFHGVLLAFAGVLLYSSVQILFDGDEEEEDLSENSIVQFSKKLLKSTDKLDGDRFFTIENGEKLATPMLLCLIAVEVSDVVFAVDSVPAVFGVTEVRIPTCLHVAVAKNATP